MFFRDFIRPFFDARALKRYPVEDLRSGRRAIDFDEFERRRAADKRIPADVCELKRDDEPTPCWWPYCNCGER
ncbi:hypothetical protein [Bradyrhizobium uaiense]|uniref:Uncharacterized protein n=1 Tax=Bradyrhizobium uaiense TaxID=2594946 RepID=A0A6P1B937_9BRAD|nr:hypothetical protein [Bradyrhizobium uaiense]NEU94794.1 hypothetical protein [Bradyrhizobium uaiense]